jgi:hypothetical protein
MPQLSYAREAQNGDRRPVQILPGTRAPVTQDVPHTQILTLDIQTGQSAEGKRALEEAVSELAQFRREVEDIKLQARTPQVDQRYYESTWTPDFMQDSMPTTQYAPIAAPAQAVSPEVEEAAVEEAEEPEEPEPVVMAAEVETPSWKDSPWGLIALVAAGGLLVYAASKKGK